jgi:hypothetical protein
MAISATTPSPQFPQAAQSSLLHRHGGRNQTPSISDIDAQGSSVASTAPSTGHVVRKLDVTA